MKLFNKFNIFPKYLSAFKFLVFPTNYLQLIHRNYKEWIILVLHGFYLGLFTAKKKKLAKGFMVQKWL